MSKEINFLNLLGTLTSKLKNFNSAPRTYDFLDKDYTIAQAFLHRPKAGGRFSPLNYEYSAAPGTVSMTINSVRLISFRLYEPMTFDAIQVGATNATASNPYFLIYDADASGLPNNLVFNSGPVALNGVGLYTVSSFGTVTLLPGLYYVGYLTDAATQMQALASANLFSLGFASTSLGAVIPSCAATRTYSLGPPNPHNLTKTFVNASFPYIAIRTI